jgi:hypothetical protein
MALNEREANDVYHCIGHWGNPPWQGDIVPISILGSVHLPLSAAVNCKINGVGYGVFESDAGSLAGAQNR